MWKIFTALFLHDQEPASSRSDTYGSDSRPADKPKVVAEVEVHSSSHSADSQSAGSQAELQEEKDKLPQPQAGGGDKTLPAAAAAAAAAASKTLQTKSATHIGLLDRVGEGSDQLKSMSATIIMVKGSPREENEKKVGAPSSSTEEEEVKAIPSTSLPISKSMEIMKERTDVEQRAQNMPRDEVGSALDPSATQQKAPSEEAGKEKPELTVEPAHTTESVKAEEEKEDEAAKNSTAAQPVDKPLAQQEEQVEEKSQNATMEGEGSQEDSMATGEGASTTEGEKENADIPPIEAADKELATGKSEAGNLKALQEDTQEPDADKEAEKENTSAVVKEAEEETTGVGEQQNEEERGEEANVDNTEGSAEREEGKGSEEAAETAAIEPAPVEPPGDVADETSGKSQKTEEKNPPSVTTKEEGTGGSKEEATAATTEATVTSDDDDNKSGLHTSQAELNTSTVTKSKASLEKTEGNRMVEKIEIDHSTGQSQSSLVEAAEKATPQILVTADT